MKKTAAFILMMVCLAWMSGASAAWAKHGHGSPQKPNPWEYKGVNSVEAFADIKHYKWELAVPPYGPMDKIALHRMVNEPRNHKHEKGLPPSRSYGQRSSHPVSSRNETRGWPFSGSQPPVRRFHARYAGWCRLIAARFSLSYRPFLESRCGAPRGAPQLAAPIIPL